MTATLESLWEPFSKLPTNTEEKLVFSLVVLTSERSSSLMYEMSESSACSFMKNFYIVKMQEKNTNILWGRTALGSFSFI